jgi:hypothetical protein
MKVVIKGKTISTFINHNTEPTLMVEQATDVKVGKIGFYVADTSGGDFANLTFMKAD